MKAETITWEKQIHKLSNSLKFCYLLQLPWPKELKGLFWAGILSIHWYKTKQEIACPRRCHLKIVSLFSVHLYTKIHHLSVSFRVFVRDLQLEKESSTQITQKMELAIPSLICNVNFWDERYFNFYLISNFNRKLLYSGYCTINSETQFYLEILILFCISILNS